MKKYFLLIALLTVAFLGLGNYSLGQDGTPVDGLVNGGPDIRGSTNSNTPTNPNQTTPTTMDQDQNSGQPTATPDLPSGTTPTSTIRCTDPSSNIFTDANAKDSASGLGCVCKDGYKEIDSKCEPCNKEGVCCGIELNTSIPFIGKCIEDTVTDQGPDETQVTGDTAFPVLMGSLTKILVTVILIVSFVLIVVGGIMIATGNPSEGKKMIIKVVIGIAILGASGVILRLINPNFFG